MFPSLERNLVRFGTCHKGVSFRSKDLQPEILLIKKKNERSSVEPVQSNRTQRYTFYFFVFFQKLLLTDNPYDVRR